MDNPELYTNHRDIQEVTIEKVFRNYFTFIEQKDKIVRIADVGCGTGELTDTFLFSRFPNAKEIIGFDISRKMIDFARQQNKNTKITYEILDIGSQDIPNEFKGQFDIVFSSFCLHWIFDQKQAFKNIFKMLKADGEILISYLEYHDFFAIWEAIAKLNIWEGYADYTKNFKAPFENPEKEINEILKDVGYKVEICKVTRNSYVFPNLNVLLKSAAAVTPSYDKIPSEERDNFNLKVLEIGKKLNLLNPNPDKSYLTNFDLIIIKAKK